MNQISINVPDDWAEAFRRLPINWDSYGGSPPTEDAITAMEDVIKNGKATIVPSNRGGIYLEIYTKTTSYLLHIGPKGEQLDD